MKQAERLGKASRDQRAKGRSKRCTNSVYALERVQQQLHKPLGFSARLYSLISVSQSHPVSINHVCTSGLRTRWQSEQICACWHTEPNVSLPALVLPLIGIV
jgi:hypothetical protein